MGPIFVKGEQTAPKGMFSGAVLDISFVYKL
ncbi:MAG: hypothetical protein ACI9H6_000845 [Patiriisocius sp.]|jgi:hypothetical protein